MFCIFGLLLISSLASAQTQNCVTFCIEFLFDTSSTSNPSGFNKTIVLVDNAIAALQNTIGTPQQIGIYEFSSNTTSDCPFNCPWPYSTVLSLYPKTGKTNLAQAAVDAKNTIMNNCDRRISNYLVIISDGECNEDCEEITRVGKEMAHLGIEVFAVQINNVASGRQYLEQLTLYPNNIISYEMNAATLTDDIVNWVYKYAFCADLYTTPGWMTTTVTPYPWYHTETIYYEKAVCNVFVLDISGSVSITEFDKARMCVGAAAQNAINAIVRTSFAVETFASVVNVSCPMPCYYAPSVIKNTQVGTGQTDVHLGLYNAINMLINQCPDGFDKKMVILSDGACDVGDCKDNLSNDGNLLNKYDIDVYAIQVSNNNKGKEYLQELTPCIDSFAEKGWIYITNMITSFLENNYKCHSLI